MTEQIQQLIEKQKTLIKALDSEHYAIARLLSTSILKLLEQLPNKNQLIKFQEDYV